MAVRGEASLDLGAETGELDELQRLFLFSRADTIYGGSNEIQRDIIARRMLGLPRSG
jgi:alkylation response protein AidB-like acyl-CoA dehydrogenase